MNLQYITDDKGKTTGVYIPIQEWNSIKSKYKGIEQDVPDWHKEIVRRRMEDYQRKPDQAIDFGTAMDEIEKDDI